MAESADLDRAAWDELWRTAGGDREFLAELLQTFFDDTSMQLGAMHRALGTGQLDEFRRAAHSLKSNSATFGARELSAMFRELEEMAGAGKLEGAEARLGRAEAECQRIRPLLEAERERLGRHR